MRLVIGFVLIVCAGRGASAAEPLDDLFAGWVAAQGRAESLVVEFCREFRDPVFGRPEKPSKASGAFRWVRTKKGEVCASYEIVAEKPKGKQSERFAGLLNCGNVYLLHHDEKTAERLGVGVADAKLTLFLEEYDNPFVVLLDRERAEAKFRLEIVKQDEWYTYLVAKPKQITRPRWFMNSFQDGRIVLMRKDSKAVPKGMPRQLWYKYGVVEYLFDIKSWRLNSPNGPTTEEFTRPEDRPGWRVVDY